MSKLHIKKDDTVIVIAGADKGKSGKVLKVLVDENRAIVEGVSFDIAKEGLRLCAQKLPVKTQFIVRRDYDKNA